MHCAKNIHFQFPIQIFTRILYPNDKNKIIFIGQFCIRFRIRDTQKRLAELAENEEHKNMEIMCESKSFEQKKMWPFKWIVLIVNGYCCWTWSKQSIHSSYALTQIIIKSNKRNLHHFYPHHAWCHFYFWLGKRDSD